MPKGASPCQVIISSIDLYLALSFAAWRFPPKILAFLLETRRPFFIFVRAAMRGPGAL
jgi:hypothetical protein